MSQAAPDSLTITPELLGLSDIKVTGVRLNCSGSSFIITTESTRSDVLCRICKKPTNGHGVGRQLRLRHLPLFGRETIIEITPRRGRCADCDGSTTTETLDWYDANSKFTKPYEYRMLFELVNSTVADVSRKEGVDYGFVESLIDRYVEAEVDYSRIEALGILGMDEISLKKGHRDFVTLITYRLNDQVNILGVVSGREKEDITRFLQKIPHHLQKTLLAVCCDLYGGYMNASKAVFKNIPVVADRFHVRKLYRKNLIHLRKSELKRLRKELTDGEYAKLKPAIALLRKQKDYFIDEEKPVVERLFELSPKLKLAYQYSRELTGIFDSHISPAQAREKITQWIEKVVSSELSCFDNFIKTLTHYMTEISHYFINRNSSGFVEGFNNKVKVLKRRCYGLSDAKRLFQRLIIDTLGYTRFAPGVPAY